MCLATPVQIKKQELRNKNKVIVDNDNEVDISLVSDAKVGDWILCHGPLAINKISAEEAGNILGMIKKCGHKHNHSNI